MRKSATVALVLFSILFTPFVVHASIGWGNCSKCFAPEWEPFEYPNTQRICRDGVIAISYDMVMVNPSYSAYYITHRDIDPVVPGRDGFYEDPDLRALKIKQASVDSEAFNTSWNRGHLAPSHILSRSGDTKYATFTMANVAPQAAYFNQRTWLNFEDHLFEWLYEHTSASLYIVTGIAYRNRLYPARTFDNISVPDFYFSAFCDPETKEAAGVVADNKGTTKTYELITAAEAERTYGGALLPPSHCHKYVLNRDYWW